MSRAQSHYPGSAKTMAKYPRKEMTKVLDRISAAIQQAEREAKERAAAIAKASAA